MKKLNILFVTVIIFTFQIYSKETNVPTVQLQLEDLNKYWKNKNLEYPVLKQKILLTGDVALIQMHLSLVEKTIRDKKVDHLSQEQKLNRIKCLDILHDYSATGIFPKNLYHSKRTPYFIDKYGTACAVGQLIISTGFGEFANKVMQENNNGYIYELNSKYPEIKEWANVYGFTMDELAWIQPCYCPIGSPATLDVTCNGGNNGYFVPNATQGPPPYSYNAWYWWSGSNWVTLFCGGCDLIAGNYKCTVIDGIGTPHDYFATINQPSSISVTKSRTNDDGLCNGAASVTASGGTPGYSFLWTPGGYTNDSINNLCQNTYTVTITDNNGCISSDTVNINFAIGIDNSYLNSCQVSIYPNPISDKFFIKTNTTEKITVDLYDVNGRHVFNISSYELESINIENLDNGAYTLKIKSGERVINKKLFILR